MKILSCIVCLSTFLVLFSSCSPGKKISREAKTAIFTNTDFAPAHIGIAIYDSETSAYLYNYQGDKYFIPASNTKLFTCYEAMKHLGDSLVGLRYVDKGNGTVEAEGNGDPSFLLAEFPNQPVLEFLKKQKKVLLTDQNWKERALGAGWAWDDYQSDYMAERSFLPVYGNLARFSAAPGFTVSPGYFQPSLLKAITGKNLAFQIERAYGSDSFFVIPSSRKFTKATIPFYTGNSQALIQMLKDTLKTEVSLVHFRIDRLPDVIKIHTQPTDSLLRIMMHRSDNFFAEQTLLMISNDMLGYMNDRAIIDTLLKTDLKNLPQKPKWVDGSGLSRYNLFSPQDFVWVLNQMKQSFAWNRITHLLATGGSGTLGANYQQYANRIFAKTGTLSNHVALSGYLITRKGRHLIFSVLVNAHQTSAANIRKGVEQFLTGIMDKL
ncbi:MAG: D-alanyl-D-alanine carboxypeptidase [Bacteroidota bacterium]|nr:D-alanyl-D-alanine carboxypeptidase [Bacteroidota bacterium]